MTSALHVNAPSSRRFHSVPAASVWDLRQVAGVSRRDATVRTLTRTDRTYIPTAARSGASCSARSRVEQRRERGRTYLLGAVFGFVMVIGTVVGLDHSAESHDPAEMETVVAVTTR